jgi:hypothetical protein
VPYESWHDHDRGRWLRGRGSGPDQTTYDDSHVEHGVSGIRLLDIHVETDGGWHTENGASRENQLEVCRVCGNPLEQLTRDDDGNVFRGRGGQPEYCPTSCRRAVEYARRKAKRSAARSRPQPKTFDLGGVYLAGVGKLETPVAEWNALDRSSRTATAHRLRGEPGAGRTPLRRPYLCRGARSTPRSKAESLASRAEILAAFRGTAESGWTISYGGPEKIARRWGAWESYYPASGVTGPIYESRTLTGKANALPGCWDRVETRWRYVERKPEPCWLTQVNERAWRISH